MFAYNGRYWLKPPLYNNNNNITTNHITRKYLYIGAANGNRRGKGMMDNSVVLYTRI